MFTQPRIEASLREVLAAADDDADADDGHVCQRPLGKGKVHLSSAQHY